MKFVAAVVLVFLIPVVALAADADSQKATDAAKSWLALVDADDCAQSWNTASPFFQSRISQAQWEKAAQAARGPMGPVVVRDVTSVDFAAALPGAPDGQYAVVKIQHKVREQSCCD